MNPGRAGGSGGAGSFRARVFGAALAGALLAGLATVVAGFLLKLSGVPGAAPRLARFLSGGGWLALLLWGAGGGALTALPWARSRRRAAATFLVAVAAFALGGLSATRPRDVGFSGSPPRGARAKARAILRSSFGSPETVARILPYLRDPDPVVREQAALALGVNVIVSAIEREDARSSSRYAALGLRSEMRDALLAALADSEESVRAEAARALWKAPRTFGVQPAAAETLAAVLERALRPEAVERLAWLALDAAAGAPHPTLKAAAARFAASTADSELARAARKAAR